MIPKETKDKIKSIVKRIVNFEDTIVFKTSSEENIKRIVDIIRYDYVVTFHLGDIDYYYNQEDESICKTDQCSAIEITLSTNIIFNYKYQKSASFYIRRNT